ncbi:MAG: hypothetical protein V5A47_09125, partial [Bacteroidales bacterium]
MDSEATGDNDGTSWTDAYDSLQTALFNVNTNDTIWVAAGTYKPTNTTNRDTSFVIPDSVAVYGGFSGSEGSLGERDWETNETILSGDIGTVNDSTDNSYHVVYFDNVSDQTVLDGFTIIEGNADGAYPEDNGGGIYLSASGSGNTCNPVIMNCIISENTADGNGGGICVFADVGTSSPSFINCIISGNYA